MRKAFYILCAAITACVCLSTGYSVSVFASRRAESRYDSAMREYSDSYSNSGEGGDGRIEAILENQRKDWTGTARKNRGEAPEKPPEPEKKKFIKWCEFGVPFEALSKAMSYDIASHKKGGTKISWIELLALLAVKYYGNFNSYKASDMDQIAAGLKRGDDFEKLRSNRYYPFYTEVYTAVLNEYLGYYELKAGGPNNSGQPREAAGYGMKVFSPIAAGFHYSHYDDFGNSRSFGYKRRHLGHDLMGSVGTPIVAVEGGTVTEIGWNRYGGWRIGIRSHDTKRYYYYAHLRKDKPYVKEFKRGDTVNAGDPIGYLGMTGYSDKPNVNNIKPPHLHFGLQLIFDESQVKGPSEIWVDVYALTRLLQKNRSVIVYDPSSKSHIRKTAAFLPDPTKKESLRAGN